MEIFVEETMKVGETTKQEFGLSLNSSVVRSLSSDQMRRLQQIFRIVFDLPPALDVTAASQESLASWDSLNHVKLLSALESEFDMGLDTADALRIKSFHTARQVLEERI